MGNFTSSTDGDLSQIFITEYDLIDRYVGNKLWAWGNNVSFGLGDGTDIPRSSPVQTIAGGTNWKQISAKGVIAAIKTDGTLWTWGLNYGGHLGDGTVTSRSSPVQTIAGGTNWKSVDAGATHTAAIKTDGTLWLWGNNYGGAIGDNTTTDRSSPVQTVAGGNNWKSVSAGQFTNVAIKNDGTLWTWGSNYGGALGDNTNLDRSSPVQTVAGGATWKQASTTRGFTVAIKTDGTLWTWGANYQGQLGDGTDISRSSPVQTIAGGTNWKSVDAGNDCCAAIKTDGTLWLWGDANYGRLGNNSISPDRSSPVQTVAGGNNWKQVAVGEAGTAAIKTDGTLWTWGYNYFGQIGDGTVTSRSSPVQTIAGGTNWKQISYSNDYTVAAITYGD